ncbi:MAG: hypothetical protein PHS04_17080 [Tissierellia bacterium]|jgi:hypothetical protein|nr:hypothetical protein [Tissierellia bacterium]
MEKNNRDMIERKAFFISGERLTSIEHKKKILVIFDMSRDEVVGVETVDIEDRFVSTEELLLFLQKKYIRVIYVSEIDSKTENLFLDSGLVVKTSMTIKNDKLFNSLYLSPPIF